MNLQLVQSSIKSGATVRISGSKSETNRLLLLQALYPNLVLENASNSDDSDVMLQALSDENPIKNIHHAGTAMRFLTAYFAVQEGKEVVLTGSSRMKERPIKILVDALRQLEADLAYVEKEGFPPLRIRGKKITNHHIRIKADVSSQYISALLLIAPKLENGLTLTLEGEITSVPYLQMTLSILETLGFNTSFDKQVIDVKPQGKIQDSKFVIESDWSSASYWYSIVALSEIGTEITLSSYKENSLQGDSVLAVIYQDFGVETVFQHNTILLRKTANCQLSTVNYHLNHAPDIAQTIAVTCFGLGIACHLTGLHTLKIKETDRLEALQNELTKLGATVSVTQDSLTLKASSEINANISIKTYQDHRMAMAFAPLALKTDLVIEEAEVVSKSYPNFWKDLKAVGFQLE